MTGLTALPGGAYADWVLPFLDEAMARGQRVALVTLVGATGSSPRPLGSQLAVCEDGTSMGLISGGCVEPSLVLDAVQAIRDGRSYLERYGQGSRFIDIRLPCGSGIDVWFDTGMTREIVTDLMAARERRVPAVLAIDMARRQRWLASDEEGEDVFLRPYAPPCRIMIAGAGHVMVALATMCRLCEIEVDLLSTDRLTCQLLERQGFTPHQVNAWAQFGWHQLDRWSGAVLLSHDHDDEADILARILGTPAFYVGALGSRHTHARRCDLLRHMGVAQKAIARICGPVGLDIDAQTPPEIATAILGQAIAHWRALPSAQTADGVNMVHGHNSAVLVAVLGAGAGSRMGGAKLDKDLGGRPLGAWAMATAQGLGAPVVLIAQSGMPDWLDPAGIEIVANPDAAAGMASSLVLAKRLAMERQATALLVMLADMPFVSHATLRELIARTAPDGVTACRYGEGHLGPPVCFGAQRLDVLERLTGDKGARYLLNQSGFADGVVVEGEELMDVDTQEDLDQARALKG